MTTTSKLGNTAFLAGSSIEGGAYTRHLAQQVMQDLDFMLVEGTIKSPDCILKLNNAAGFVQVKYDEKFVELCSPTPFSTKPNQHGVLCINGFKMKEKYCGVDKSSVFPRLTGTSTCATTTDSTSTEMKYESIFDNTSLGKQFEVTLNTIRRMQVRDDVEGHQSKFISVCNAFRKSISHVLPMMGPIANAERFYEQSFQDIISLTFPMYYIKIPEINQVRLNVLLEFYEKYKYLGNESMLEDYIEYGSLSMNYDVDLVPALKLDFWPNDMQVFLNRIQKSRPELYRIICEQGCMHVIPKWSNKTPNVDQELEFRYSYSAIERLLAKNRTRREQILNGVARSIYYLHLKKVSSNEDSKKTIIPSYFVKTTVLWMCEERNFNDLCSETDDDQTIAEKMAREWLIYARSLLCSGYCPHYFIDSFNLLEPCSEASLRRAAFILDNDVNLNESIKIDVLIKQDKLMSKQQQTTENWLRNRKVNDILVAVNDYRLLRENWLCPSEENHDEGDVSDCFYTLNQLRALDGDKQQNWSTFQRLFLTTDQTTWLAPTWDQQVADCSVCDFVDGIITLGSTMRQILEAMEKTDFEQSLNRNISETQFFPVQNLLNDLIQPANIVQNGLMTSWIPMFTSSYFNASSRSVPSIRQRSIIDNHPTGPLQDILQGRSCPTPLDSESWQTYRQYAQSVSYRFLDLLNDAPDGDMTLEDLLTYYNQPSTTTQPITTSSIEEQILSYSTNPYSVNRESITLIVFDPDRAINNMTDDEYRTINDYVLVYREKSQLLTYVRSISEEFIFIILCQYALDEEFLTQLNDLNQIHSIFIYSTKQEIDNYKLKNRYSKLLDIFTEQNMLFEQVRIKIQQPFALRLGFYDSEQKLTKNTKLSIESTIFLWNLLLKDLLANEQPKDKSFLIQDCQEYYCRNIIEMENIKRFEKTYDHYNAHEWYSKSCFVSKLLTKAFHTVDIERLKLLNFFIRDLSVTMKESSTIEHLYFTRILRKTQVEKLLEKIGQLMNFSGFLLVHSSFDEIVPYGNESQLTVSFEIRNVPTSVVHMIDSNTVIINLGVTFKLNTFNFDDKLGIWIARLIFTDDGVQIAQNYVDVQKQIMERMTLPLIMVELLIIMNNFSTIKNYLDSLKNEDEAIIYYYYGILYYEKGEYTLALDNFQTI
ncbi:unnamed protein product [Rotaria sp. Silwood2]|nr:unnamed protein product [Rotaria sp. Silwood2]CAF4512231.1 unnamed protein product [Rotaria sp. Silwood2]